MINLFISCLNFWDKAWGFLSFRVFGLLSSSLLLSEFLRQSLMIFIIQGFRTIVFIFIVVWISETKLEDFYHSGFSDYCLHLYCCLNFWDKAWWFLSFRVFGLLSSSLLLSEFLRQSLRIFIIQGFRTIVFIFIVVWISETKLDDFYHSGFSDYCLHLYCCLNFWDKAWWFLSIRVFGLLSSFFYCIHNVSADVSSGLLQVFLVGAYAELRTTSFI